MKKLIKYTVLTITGFVGLIAIGLIILITFVNPNKFKPLIEKSVTQATGRTINLDGDISWKIYPNIGLTLRDVSLSNPSNESTFVNNSNFFSLKSADISIALLPLLNHKIELKTLNIDGLDIALIQKNNVNNWTFTPQQIPTEATNEKAESAEPIKFENTGFSLTNTIIKYDN